ncbi:zona pellucida sperm-binding protein 3-like [Gouania willdenowi]|uniref:zona pellucida sperm-binding protein 3-like n=1 Tax=Gouania willdenowi TaxID=441366 RepID=UPI001056174B|nr:zona pellucida sperm-binding protein 3-like [Gouania willdenowi]
MEGRSLQRVGAPVNSNELRLGVEDLEHCRASPSMEDEYRIVVGLMDCGTKHWMTEDSLVYTNLMIYTPATSLNGVIRMDEAVIPIECHYERKYRLSSSSIMPTWIPFTSTQTAVELLDFSLKLMTDDWLHERYSNVFYLGDLINVEASVRVGHHMGLRVFVSSCVATLTPDVTSEPSYTFIESGCLVDSQIPGSRSNFLPRTRNDKLQLSIDSFKFHNDNRVQLYLTCHLTAAPVNDPEAMNKACTLINERWKSADRNDFLCGYCQNEVGQTPSKPGSASMFHPRGFGQLPEADLYRSKMSSAFGQDARVGPLMVLPRSKSKFVHFDELPPVLEKMRPAFYGSQWRSGVNKLDLDMDMLPETADIDKDPEDSKDVPLEKGNPELDEESSLTTLVDSVTEAPTEPDSLSPVPTETVPSNGTETQSEPKK